MKKPDDAKTFEYGGVIWCDCECPHYVPMTKEYGMDMRCKVLDVELMYYDGPIAKCCDEDDANTD